MLSIMPQKAMRKAKDKMTGRKGNVACSSCAEGRLFMVGEENKGMMGQQPGGQPQGEQPQQKESQSPPASQEVAKPKRPRGLAAANPETRRAVARRGGEAVSRDRKHMAEIGRKGGEAVSQDRKHMSSIGRKGGEAVSQNREHMAEIGRKGGEARGHHGTEQEPEAQEPETES
jgi:general stress protein YciG